MTQILGVFALNGDTPALIVIYIPVDRTELTPVMLWLQEHRFRPGGSIFIPVTVRATPLEQALLLTLLDQNAKHLAASYKPDLLWSEKAFKLSFILPLGPLTFEDIGKLNSDPGCKVCGNKSTSRCSGCQSESYCSAGLLVHGDSNIIPWVDDDAPDTHWSLFSILNRMPKA